MSGVAHTLRPEHRTFLAIDIEKFNAVARTDVHRAIMRRALREIVEQSVSRAMGDLERIATRDSGDGLLILIDPLYFKSDVLNALYPLLVTGLEHHNRLSAPEVQMRWRVAIHSGEVVIQEGESGGEASQAVNLTFRILDSDEFRRALRDSDRSVGLIVSSEYYENVVRHGYGSIDPGSYRKQSIRTKEGKIDAWVLVAASVGKPVAQGAAPLFQEQPTFDAALRQRLSLSDLPNDSLYMTISDVHNFKLYGEEHPQVPLVNHLESALLLGSRVVLHCADPLRMESVARLCKAYQPMIDQGVLLFLLGENAVDPTADFAAYIDQRIADYSDTPLGANDVATLKGLPEQRWEVARSCLETSPIALTRGYSGSREFARLIEQDISPSEILTVSEDLPSSQLVSCAGSSLKKSGE